MNVKEKEQSEGNGRMKKEEKGKERDDVKIYLRKVKIGVKVTKIKYSPKEFM